MRDELLSIEQFDTLLEAQVLVGEWRAEYTIYRPHSALGMLPPSSSLGSGGSTKPSYSADATSSILQAAMRLAEKRTES